MPAQESRMPNSEPGPRHEAQPPDAFPPTAWTRIEIVKDANSSQSREALAELCEAYWRPVYAFIRRKRKRSRWGGRPDAEFFHTSDRAGRPQGCRRREGSIPIVPHGVVYTFHEQSADI